VAGATARDGRGEAFHLPPEPRRELPSWDELTLSHKPSSDPPAIQVFDRMIGRYVRRGFRWTIRTGWGTLVTALTTAATMWLTHHFLHWMR
jgi:hypothetical protein